MKRWAWLILAWVVSACAAPQPAGERPQAAAPAAGGTVSFRFLSWGATLHAWTVDEAGAVLWEEPDPPGSALPAGSQPLTIAIKRFQLDAAGHAALRAAVARAEQAQALSDECKTYIPDGPYGRLTLTGGGAGAERGFMVNASCMKGPQADKAQPVFAADRIVREAAATAPIADRRQE